MGYIAYSDSNASNLTVHPHACGVHIHFLTRVKSAIRFIPTHVGYMRVPFNEALVKSVHPHACGVHAQNTQDYQQGHGSSPRMWGTLHPCRGIAGGLRFIPTHVGYIAFVDRVMFSLAVHPHACGVHSRCEMAMLNMDGSSPRMWGTCAQFLIRAMDVRFIPTHVGYIRCRSSSLMQFSGSSPRMWGTYLIILPQNQLNIQA